MFCSECGNKLKKGDLFCTSCGNKIGEDNNVKTTPNVNQDQSDEVKTLGVLGLIFSILFMPLGLLLSIISLIKGKGYKNGFAIAGIIISAIKLIFYLIVVFLYMTLVFTISDRSATRTTRYDYDRTTSVYHGASF